LKKILDELLLKFYLASVVSDANSKQRRPKLIEDLLRSEKREGEPAAMTRTGSQVQSCLP
jgi:hypothetical protein